MIALSLLAIAQAAPLPPPASEQDIVVVARKLQLIEVDMKALKRGGFVMLDRCRVTKPSGHAELDAIPCGVAQECANDKLATRKALVACVEERSQRGLDAVIAAWRAGWKVPQ